MSLVEAIANVAVGFLVALLTQIIVFPLFALQVSLDDNLAISGLFTMASIGRSYVRTSCEESSKQSERMAPKRVPPGRSPGGVGRSELIAPRPGAAVA